ncbi:hypothetical protein SALBM135S_08428 [Streptomyces alboniger]
MVAAVAARLRHDGRMRNRPVLVFDGDCGFCTSAVRVIRRRVRPRCDIVPWQRADLGALGVSEERAQYEVLWVTPVGKVYGGAQAVAKLLLSAGGGWSPAGAVLALPPGALDRLRRLPARGEQPPAAEPDARGVRATRRTTAPRVAAARHFATVGHGPRSSTVRAAESYVRARTHRPVTLPAGSADAPHGSAASDAGPSTRRPRARVMWGLQRPGAWIGFIRPPGEASRRVRHTVSCRRSRASSGRTAQARTCVRPVNRTVPSRCSGTGRAAKARWSRTRGCGGRSRVRDRGRAPRAGPRSRPDGATQGMREAIRFGCGTREWS